MSQGKEVVSRVRLSSGVVAVESGSGAVAQSKLGYRRRWLDGHTVDLDTLPVIKDE